jgi:hypothetical protein
MPVAKKTVYLNADRTKMVSEGHADATFLLAREGAYISEADAKQYGVGGDEPQAYDAIADHAEKHGGETQEEADRKRLAMFEGQPGPDGPVVEGERSKKAIAPADNKARSRAPENK